MQCGKRTAATCGEIPRHLAAVGACISRRLFLAPGKCPNRTSTYPFPARDDGKQFAAREERAFPSYPCPVSHSIADLRRLTLFPSAVWCIVDSRYPLNLIQRQPLSSNRASHSNPLGDRPAPISLCFGGCNPADLHVSGRLSGSQPRPSSSARRLFSNLTGCLTVSTAGQGPCHGPGVDRTEKSGKISTLNARPTDGVCTHGYLSVTNP